jgi:hypothetical protein
MCALMEGGAGAAGHTQKAPAGHRERRRRASGLGGSLGVSASMVDFSFRRSSRRCDQECPRWPVRGSDPQPPPSSSRLGAFRRKSHGHPFYQAVNRVLAAKGFDGYAEQVVIGQPRERLRDLEIFLDALRLSRSRRCRRLKEPTEAGRHLDDPGLVDRLGAAPPGPPRLLGRRACAAVPPADRDCHARGADEELQAAVRGQKGVKSDANAGESVHQYGYAVDLGFKYLRWVDQQGVNRNSDFWLNGMPNRVAKQLWAARNNLNLNRC